MNKKNIWLEHISIEGLHGDIDVEASFHDGINVIYGANGVGKTTLLHIISNAINMDFDRFNHLDFERIVLFSSEGGVMTIEKRKPPALPHVTLNKRKINLTERAPNGTNSDRSEMQALFGKQPIYAPAFRSVLQKIEENANSGWNRLINLQFDTFRDTPNSPEERAVSIKTKQCREWFGDFVPQIRYPSVQEAESELETYWTRADSAARREQSILINEATNKILAELLGQDPGVVRGLIDEILSQDDNDDEDSELDFRDSFFSQLSLRSRTPFEGAMDPRRLASIYIEALVKSKRKSQGVFKAINLFLYSMNKFLGPSRKFSIGAKHNHKATPRVDFEGSRMQGYGINGLSSGERQLLTLLYSAWQGRDDSRMMLIDEPELSLHIDWQRQILFEMHRQGGQQIIACTHSPEVAADIDEGYQVFDRFSRHRSQDGF